MDAIDPLEIILFGSVAQAAEGHDLDLLVITEDDGESPQPDRSAALRSALRPLRRAFDIDDYVVTRSDFVGHLRRGSPFVRKIVSEGICIYMREGIKAWRQQAEDECNTASYLHAGGFCRGACYHAHQCIEKSIKTMLLELGWELERVHSIRRLTAIAEDYRVPLSLAPHDLDFIDAIYHGRYPAESGLLPLGDPTQADAERGVALAAKCLEALTTFLATREQVEQVEQAQQTEQTEQGENPPFASAEDPPDSGG